MRKNRGFTLIEILIAIVIVFLLFSGMYSVFYSMSNTVKAIQQKMEISELIFRFLNTFKKEIKCMIYKKDDENTFEMKEISFLSMMETAPYPVRVTYTVKKTPENYEKLLRKQENLLNNYSFTFYVLDRCDSINFLFYSDGMWREYVDKMEKVVAIGIEIYRDGEKVFFPVRLYGDFDEEKK